MTTRLTLSVLSLLAVAPLAACTREPGSRVLAPNSSLAASSSETVVDDAPGPRFSHWSAPINLGPPVNSPAAEQTPAISKDGLSLYFQCLDCPGGYGGFDIWVAERLSVESSWGPPRNLGPRINTAANEGSPALSRDGHNLLFDSNRTGGFGGTDIYVSRRQNRSDNLAWEPPVNLGPAVNTSANEAGAELVPNDTESDAIPAGALFFASNRSGGVGNEDIYSVAVNEDGTFGQPNLEQGLNSSSRDSGPTLRRDGLEIFFVSERPDGVGGADIWTSTRKTLSDPWSPPINLGSPINSQKNDGGPALSSDGTTLYFQSPRDGNVGGPFFDLFMVTREKARGHQ